MFLSFFLLRIPQDQKSDGVSDLRRIIILLANILVLFLSIFFSFLKYACM